MDLFDPLSRVSPTVLLLIMLLATVALCAAAVGGCRAAVFLHRLRRTQHQHIGHLRIQAMLRALGIRENRYLRRTNALRVEVHLLRCQRCPDPQACDAFLSGNRDAGPEEFCPNFSDLTGGKSGPMASRSGSDRGAAIRTP